MGAKLFTMNKILAPRRSINCTSREETLVLIGIDAGGERRRDNFEGTMLPASFSAVSTHHDIRTGENVRVC